MEVKSLDFTFPSGKYKYRTYREVMLENPKYLGYLMKKGTMTVTNTHVLFLTFVCWIYSCKGTYETNPFKKMWTEQFRPRVNPFIAFAAIHQVEKSGCTQVKRTELRELFQEWLFAKNAMSDPLYSELRVIVRSATYVLGPKVWDLGMEFLKTSADNIPDDMWEIVESTDDFFQLEYRDERTQRFIRHAGIEEKHQFFEMLVKRLAKMEIVENERRYASWGVW